MPNSGSGSEMDGFVRALLILLGIGVGVWALWQWSNTGPGPRTTVTEMMSPAPSVEGSPPPSSQVVTKTKDRKHGTTETASTYTGAASKTTTTIGPSVSTHSDAVTLALLGIGLLLLLSGVYWGKLQSISAAGISLSFAQSTAGSADKLNKLIAAIDARVKRRATIRALQASNKQIATLTARVEALEQGRPLEEFLIEPEQFAQSRPALVEMSSLVDQPDPDEAEVEGLRADADAAVADLQRRVDELRRAR